MDPLRRRTGLPGASVGGNGPVHAACTHRGLPHTSLLQPTGSALTPTVCEMGKQPESQESKVPVSSQLQGCNI